MYSSPINTQYEKLPDNLKQEANDFIEFLLYKNKKFNNKGFDTVRTDLQIQKSGDSLKQKNGNKKKSLILEEFENKTYPYAPDVIRFDDKIYVLSEKLDCKVVFENDFFIITNELFDITVWGDSRTEAEKAFSFTFSALYQNYVNDDDVNLSETAKNIKIKLKQIVKAEYIDETTEV